MNNKEKPIFLRNADKPGGPGYLKNIKRLKEGSEGEVDRLVAEYVEEIDAGRMTVNEAVVDVMSVFVHAALPEEEEDK